MPQGYFKVSHALFEDPKFIKLRPISKILYLYLLKHQNRFDNYSKIFFHSDRVLAKETNLSRRSILRARKELIDQGMIKFISDYRKTGQYIILPSGDSQSHPLVTQSPL